MRLDVNRTALLIVDMQRYQAGEGETCHEPLPCSMDRGLKQAQYKKAKNSSQLSGNCFQLFAPPEGR